VSFSHLFESKSKKITRICERKLGKVSEDSFGYSPDCKFIVATRLSQIEFLSVESFESVFTIDMVFRNQHLFFGHIQNLIGILDCDRDQIHHGDVLHQNIIKIYDITTRTFVKEIVLEKSGRRPMLLKDDDILMFDSNDSRVILLINKSIRIFNIETNEGFSIKTPSDDQIVKIVHNYSNDTIIVAFNSHICCWDLKTLDLIFIQDYTLDNRIRYIVIDIKLKDSETIYILRSNGLFEMRLDNPSVETLTLFSSKFDCICDRDDLGTYI
jgi:WD40 repeat protein